jgi:endonuclease YncB( thermonuclease family)
MLTSSGCNPKEQTVPDAKQTSPAEADRVKITMVFDCQVVKWVDGDTVDLKVDLGFSIFSKQRIRLAGINTPEKGQTNYSEARNKALELAPIGQQCSLVCHGKDKYGRYIGNIAVGSVNVNQALLESGFAEAYIA